MKKINSKLCYGGEREYKHWFSSLVQVNVFRGPLVRHQAKLAMTAFEGAHLEFHRLSNHGHFYFLFVESQGRKDGWEGGRVASEMDKPPHCPVTGWQMDGNPWIPLILLVSRVTIKPGISEKTLLRGVADILMVGIRGINKWLTSNSNAYLIQCCSIIVTEHINTYAWLTHSFQLCLSILFNRFPSKVFVFKIKFIFKN